VRICVYMSECTCLYNICIFTEFVKRFSSTGGIFKHWRWDGTAGARLAHGFPPACARFTCSPGRRYEPDPTLISFLIPADDSTAPGQWIRYLLTILGINLLPIAPPRAIDLAAGHGGGGFPRRFCELATAAA
jgi:hypothetical protein